MGGDKLVFLWDVSTARTLRRWAGHFGRVNAVDFGGGDNDNGNDGNKNVNGGKQNPSVVVSGSFDATVRVWDARSQSTKPVQVLDEAKDAVQAVRVQGAEIVAGSVDGCVRCYDVRMGHVIKDLVAVAVAPNTTSTTSSSSSSSTTTAVTSLALTSDREAYLASSLDSTIRLMDRGDGKCLRTFKGHRNTEYRVRSCLGLGDKVVVSGSEDGVVYAWDILSGEIVAQVQAHAGKVASAVAWNGLRRQWASAGVDGTVCVWGGAVVE